MEMVFHEEEDELSVMNETPHDASDKDAALQSHSGQDSKVAAAVPGAGDVKKSSCRAAAVCLGLLCLLLLLVGLITLVFRFIKSNSVPDMEMVLLNNSCNNLTKERDQLQTSYNNLITERHQIENNLRRQKDQLQTSYNQLVTERKQLQERFESLTTDLQRKLQDIEASLKNLKEERGDLKRTLSEIGWVSFGGSVYHISSTQKTWQQSRDDCLQKGADLVIINSKEEQAFMNQFNKYMWIGLTDSETEGTWKWVDGTPMTTSYWGSGEPNGAKGENCGDIKTYNDENSWNDESCSDSVFWICEKKVLP